MSSLPIYEAIPALARYFLDHSTLILQAPPGAGKSTALPLELLKEPWMDGKKILMLEPRRLAARSVAARLAHSNGDKIGETVGYRVRFDNQVGPSTRIEVITEGILTRILQQDNALEGVGLVIFDEFHERSLHADLALALCRETQQVLREDLRILIMSATLDGEKLSALLDGAPIVTSKGRQYPIEVHYVPQEDTLPMWQDMSAAIKRVLREQEGDILAFLPGTSEIRKTMELLLPEGNTASFLVCPLYGDLSLQEQQKAILPDAQGRRKVVLATSIAETSLTIEGIKTVIDSGWTRASSFDPRSGLNKLVTTRVTLDAADQRAGRAGRMGPGVCYRLWSKGTQQQLLPHRTPEILESDLAPTVLELANWGVHEVHSLTWLTPPPVGALKQAKEVLTSLKGIESDKITAKGKEMLALPTHPRIAHLIMEGVKKGWAALASDVAALLEEKDPLPKGTGADLAFRVEVLRKWRNKEYVQADRASLERIEKSASSWRKILQIMADNGPFLYQEVGFLLATAYPERVARQKDQDAQRYRLANGRIAKLPSGDSLETETWLSIAHLDAGTTEGKIFLAAPLNIGDLRHLLEKKRVVAWDTTKDQLIARIDHCFGDLAVSSSPLEQVTEEEKVGILCQVVREEGEKWLTWSDELVQWQYRLASLRAWRPSEEWPDVSTPRLLETVEEWLSPFLAHVRKKEDFKKLDLEGILKGRLSWEMAQRLDVLAPSKILVPSGFEVNLSYSPDGSNPILSVRLQEMFGLLETPAINEGKTQVLLHLLSPGYKPVQVTQDLKSFWKNAYPEVRKELRMRYPKHAWPEDPWTAQAVRGAKKRY